MIDPKDTRMDELDEAVLPCPGCGRTDKLGIDGHDFGDIGSGHYAVKCQNCGWCGPESYRIEDARARWNRRSTIGGEPVATQYRYWYSSGEPGVWLNERRKDADDLLESGVLIREETRALYLGDSEAGAETSLRNVQRSGWKLVPVEPTEAMTLAGIEARQKRPPNTIYGHTADFGIEQGARDRWYADEAYRAMLAAAPTSPAPPPTGGDVGIVTLAEAYQNALAATETFYDAASVEETLWTGWGDQIVPFSAEMRRVKAKQALTALRDAAPSKQRSEKE